MKYKSLDDNGTFAIIFDDGDAVMPLLQKFADERKLKASRFSAIGAFSQAELGFFDFSIKDYKKIPVDEQVEVLSFLGDIAQLDGEPKIHAHAVLGKADGTAIGGHFLDGTAHPTLEIILEEAPGHLQRKIDEATGLPLINIEQQRE